MRFSRVLVWKTTVPLMRSPSVRIKVARSAAASSSQPLADTAQAMANKRRRIDPPQNVLVLGCMSREHTRASRLPPGSSSAEHAASAVPLGKRDDLVEGHVRIGGDRPKVLQERLQTLPDFIGSGHVHIPMNADIADMVSTQQQQAVPRWKRCQYGRGLAEIIGEVIAVAVDERHPACGRKEHELGGH